jgi:hypothetical protein
MNPLKLSIAVAVAGLLASTGTVVAGGTLSSPSYTYFFTATPGLANYSPAFDGSTITIQDYGIIAFDLVDKLLGIEFTQADSSYTYNSSSISFYSDSTWTGSFAIGYVQRETQYYFSGYNYPSGGELDFTATADPGGTWTAVPDALNSLQLLALALAGLAASQLYFRRPVVVLARN